MLSFFITSTAAPGVLGGAYSAIRVSIDWSFVIVHEEMKSPARSMSVLRIANGRISFLYVRHVVNELSEFLEIVLPPMPIGVGALLQRCLDILSGNKLFVNRAGSQLAEGSEEDISVEELFKPEVIVPHAVLTVVPKLARRRMKQIKSQGGVVQLRKQLLDHSVSR